MAIENLRSAVAPKEKFIWSREEKQRKKNEQRLFVLH